MIEWSLDAFRACDAVSAIVVAAPPGSDLALGGDVTVVAGGTTRARSVANALVAVETELVAIHDAARPLLTPELVEELVAALDAEPEAAGVIAATPVTDTVKQVEEGTIAQTLDRSQLWAAQTPQVFRAGALRDALDVEAEATDEATLVEAAGGTVLIHPTSPRNLKVTTPFDLRLAELLLEDRSR
jgi:2-C-methyl-D-erythritol 4-phosphate cytidylyltransferase